MFLDVAIVVAVSPVAEVVIAELVAEQRDDAVLRCAFGLADFTPYPLLSPVPPGRLNDSARAASTPYIAFVIFDAVLLQKIQILFLEGSLLMMLALFLNVADH